MPLKKLSCDRRDHHGVLVQSALVTERHHAIDQRKQAVIATTTDIAACVEFSAALAHDDRASSDGLAAESLDAEHLRFRVATVARGAAAFFFCYGVLLLANYLPALMVEISTSV